MAPVTGTFSGTGNSESIAAGRAGGIIAIDATFAGTATVNVQWLVDGTNWRTIEVFTGSFQKVYDTGFIPVRLNCSAHTNNVTYALAQG
jgi:hypothetical protein